MATMQSHVTIKKSFRLVWPGIRIDSNRTDRPGGAKA